ncbi:proteinase-activated receptor 2-like [Tautogolabrus adspersus]
MSISVNMILGLPLNGYVIWLILGAPRETMTSDIFSLNLALSELLFASSGIWFWLSVKLHSLFCGMVYVFSLGLLYTARPLFQSCICVERYVGVVHPVVFLRFKPLRYRVACCCVLWLIILISCIYSFYTSWTSMYLFLYFIETVLFFGVMLFCCLSVLWALKRPGPGERDTGKRTSNAMKRKAFKIILIIMIFMTLNFFLYLAAIPLQCFLEPYKPQDVGVGWETEEKVCTKGKSFQRINQGLHAVLLR